MVPIYRSPYAPRAFSQLLNLSSVHIWTGSFAGGGAAVHTASLASTVAVPIAPTRHENKIIPLEFPDVPWAYLRYIKCQGRLQNMCLDVSSDCGRQSKEGRYAEMQKCG